MNIPLSFWDISLWLALTAIILLITLEYLSPKYGKTKLLIEKNRLRNAAFTISALFILAFVVRICEIIISTL